MNWKLSFLPEALKDIKKLGSNQRIMVMKAVRKVQINPLPISEGGYGNRLVTKETTI